MIRQTEATFADSVDKQGPWLKKRGKYHFGFKKRYLTDNEGLVLGVLTTTASKNEVRYHNRDSFTRKHLLKSR